MAKQESKQEELAPPAGGGILTHRSESAVALVSQMQEDAGSGNEEVGADDLAIPYLSVVQGTSEAVKPAKEGYNPEARAGMFLNTMTGHLYLSPLRVVRCTMRPVFVERVRGKMGAFVAEHPASTPLALQVDTQYGPDGREDLLPNGHILNKVHRHYLILVETMESVVFSMRSSNLKESRKWNSLAGAIYLDSQTGKEVTQAEALKSQTFLAPSYASLWDLSTHSVSNERGDWYAVSVRRVPGLVDDPGLYRTARRFCDLIRGGATHEVGDDLDGAA